MREKIDSLKIKMLMLERNLNNTSLAKKMGTTRQWLGNVLEREHATKEYVCKIAKALEVDPKEIIKNRR
ncbi:helix-turn-helix transcriptional regulator [uncultured Anaerococcus sp.]|uniref:helix-turn-helix transcriptional regulator n=1 Tax=uncultured Anaerococcus sp. TaxID=293428 RepID=UPI00280AEA41|nr:helix-turn-helix transcriptional regulator [uncultured Anaerococcus sp.]